MSVLLRWIVLERESSGGKIAMVKGSLNISMVPSRLISSPQELPGMVKEGYGNSFVINGESEWLGGRRDAAILKVPNDRRYSAAPIGGAIRVEVRIRQFCIAALTTMAICFCIQMHTDLGTCPNI